MRAVALCGNARATHGRLPLICGPLFFCRVLILCRPDARHRAAVAEQELLDAMNKDTTGAAPDAAKLLEIRTLHRLAYNFQVEKVAIQKENDLLIKNYSQRLSEDMGMLVS